MENPTQQLIELVRRAHGGERCSYYKVAKLLGVEPAAVSRWRKGTGQMSDSSITAACGAAGLIDSLRWRAFIGAERERGPEGDHWREFREDFRRIEQGLQPREGSELELFIKGLGKRVASILLTGLALVALGNVTPAEAYAHAAGGSAVDRFIHYAHYRRRLASWFLNWRWPLARFASGPVVI